MIAVFEYCLYSLPRKPSASGREDRQLRASIRPTLNGFLAAHRKRMYSDGILAPSHLLLADCWASNLLSALSEVQVRKIIHMEFATSDCSWIREDLNLAPTGFQSAGFVNTKG